MIQGNKREEKEFSGSILSVGLFEGSVICVNPSTEEYKELLGIELKEDSKATEYLGESRDGNTSLRVSVWLEDIKTEKRFNVSFFLEDKIRTNKDETKKQYINTIGICAWADDPNNLPLWFTKRDYREAHSGEEELYTFLRNWLALDYSDENTILELDWRKLMRGNVKELQEQVEGSFAKNVVAMATVISKEKDGEVREYQSIYNRDFLPAYSLKQFRLVDYASTETLEKLKAKKPKELKVWERFAIGISSEFGCRDFHSLRELHDYDPNENITSGNSVIASDDSSY